MEKILLQKQRGVGLFLLIFLLSLFIGSLAFGQTKGIIFKPAAGAGKSVLDPNNDGYTSATTSGFVSDDRTESEIPYIPIVVPMLEPNSDLGPGPDCGYTDFVDSGLEDPALIYYDGTNFLVRFRLGKTLPNSKGYSLLIDTDQRFGPSGANADPDYTLTNPGFEIEINLQTNFGVFVYNVNSGCPGSPSSSFAGETNYQKSIALTNNCSDPDYFYDFYVPFSALTTLGVTSTTGLRMAIITQMNPQPAICNNALSDFGGIDDAACGSNFASCYGTIIDNYPPTPITGINTQGLDRSACPSITSPISAGATSVSGTSSEASGALIRIFKNGTQIGTASVSSGTWTLTGISPSLIGNDIITATATAIGKSESISNCNPVTVAATCTGAITSITACNAGKAFSGTGTAGAVIKVYYGTSTTPIAPSSGNVFVSGSVTVDGSGNWLWRCLSGGQTTSCTAGGGPCLVDGSYRVTQTLTGQCESQPTFICIGSAGTTATPTITTSPVLTTTTSVSGTSATGASIILYADGVQIATGTASGTSWTISGLSLTFGKVLTAKAIFGTLCLSNASTGTTVTRVTATPLVTGTYCSSSAVTSVTGRSGEAAGTVIQVFKNGVAHGSTTTVAANGNWTASTGISFSSGDIISAKATITGGIQSAVSNTITVGNKTTTTASITTSPVIEGSTSISGTGTNGNVIRLYVDDVQVGSTSTVASGTWTIAGLLSTDLTAGSVLTVTATSTGNCESNPSAGVTVQCNPPASGLSVSPDNATVCSGSIVVNVTITGSQSLVVYQLYNGASASGSAVLGTGGNITLNSGPLSSNTTLTVKSFKIAGVTCETTMTDNLPVTIAAVPSAALTVVTSASTVCTGTGTNIQVQSSEPGFNYQLRNNVGNTTIGSAVAGTGGTINLPTGNLGAITTFNVLVTGSAPTNCSVALSTTATVNITPVPTIADAGSDQQVCSSVGTTSMTANTPLVGTGAWAQISGPLTANIASPTSPTSSITGLTASGTYRFQWTISNSPCTASADLVDIIVKAPPTVSAAGSNQNVCVGSPVTLGANSPVVGTGTWSVVSGPSTNSSQFGDVSLNTSSFTPAGGAGSYVLRWTISNSPCIASASDVAISATDVPSAPSVSAVTQPTCSVLSGTIVFNTQSSVEYGLNGIYQVSPAFTDLVPGNYTLSVRSTVNNGCVATAAGAVTIDPFPTCTNFPPVANDDSPSSINEDSAGSTFNVTSNDTDADGTVDVATVDLDVSTSGIQNTFSNVSGDWTVDALGSVTYVPAPDFNGTASIDYRVNDDLGASSNAATISLAVNAVNDALVLSNNTEAVISSPFSGNVFVIGDHDPDSTLLSANTTPVSGPSHGSIIVNTDGTYTYTPTPGYTGSDIVTIEICDNGFPLPASCTTKTITFNINIPNSSPVANNDSPSSIDEDSAGTTFSVTSNDTDADGTIDVSSVDLDPLTSGIQNTFSDASGDWTVNALGSVTYVPAPNFNGTASIDYRVDDNLGAVSNTATISLTVNAVNDALVLSNNTEAVTSSPFSGNVLVIGDIDPDGTVLMVNVTPVSGPSHGSILVNTDGTYTYTPTPGYTGADIVMIEICDNGLPLPASCASKTITFNVNVTNSSPVANNDSPSSINEDSAGTTFSVTSNDTDTDGTIDVSSVDLNPLTSGIQNTFSDGSGDWSVDALGSVTYVPAPNFNGTASIDYRVDDNLGAASNTAIISLIVDAVNDTPILSNNTESLTSSPFSGNVLVAGDNDPDGTMLAVNTTPVSGPSHGSILVNTDGTYTYTPTPGYTGSDIVTIEICDNGFPLPASCTTKTITFNINIPNSSPVANNDSPSSINEDSAGTTFSVTSNDTDADGTIDVSSVDLDPLTSGIQNTFSDVSGDWSVDALGNVTYVPVPDFNGTVSIDYHVDDNLGAVSNTATISLTVNAVNDIPLLSDNTEAVTSSPFSGNVLVISDIDPEGTVLTVNITPVSGPSHGSIIVNTDGTYTYTPTPGYTGSDIVTIEICDNGLPLPASCANKTITFNVNVTNSSPVANNDSPSSINEDSAGTTFSVTSNDTDTDGTIDVSSVDLDPLTSGIQNTFSDVSGDWSVDALGSVTYVPALNFNGMASIDYRVKDNLGAASNTAIISLTVNPVNDPPVLSNNTEMVNNSPFSGNVLVIGDIDPEGTVLAVNITPVSGPSHGSIFVNADGTYTYTPTAGYIGTDVVTIEICDNGLPLPASCATKTITFNVNVTNSSPVASNNSPSSINEDSAGITFNVTSNDTDADGTIDVSSVDLDLLTAGVQNTFSGANGDWSVDALGNVTYVPALNFNGTASIDYHVKDNLGAVSNAATISLTVNAVNDMPVLSNNVETVISLPFSGNVLVVGDIDPDGTALIVNTTPISGPSHGSILVNTNGVYNYTPTPGYTGTDIVTIQICDNGLPLPASCATKTITFNVNVINSSPVANNDSPSSINEDSAGTIFSVTSNDTDTDGTIDVSSVDLDPSTLGIQNTFSNASGDWSVDALGSVTYVPASSFNGTASIDYRVNDNLGTSSNTATISLTVKAVNDTPVLSNNIETVSNSLYTGNVLAAGDNDPDGTVLIVNTTPISGPSHGSILVNTDGTYTYTPTLGYAGMDIVTIQICDSGLPLPASCATKTITFNMNVTNSSPVATSATVSMNENSAAGTIVITVLASDPDAGDVLTFTIDSGNSNNAFSINPNTGLITVLTSSAIDFEVNPTFVLNIRVTDSKGASTFATVTIQLNDLDNEDTDGDSIPDGVEKGNVPSNPVDTDKDGVPDFKDTDSDNDGVPDEAETGSDPAHPVDTDSDGIPDYRDTDDDNDGIPTLDEDSNHDGNYLDDDCDRDLIPDYLDKDTCKLKPELGFSPNGDGNSDFWQIHQIEDYPDNKVTIINRWGNEVFRMENYDNRERAWGGQSSGILTLGDLKVPDGTYFYFIELGDGSIPITGYLVLKR